MSVNYIDKSTGDLIRVAGGGNDILYADVPVGTIMPYGGSNPVDGFLLCQGQAVSRTTYSELFAVIGTSFGSGDGSTTFNVPDLREATTKGIGLSGKSSNHFDSDGVALGEFVEDRIQNHLHRTRLTNLYFQTGGENLAAVTDEGSSGIGAVGEIVSGRHGATTEVKAVGVNYIIKAKQVGVPADIQSAIEEQNSYSTEETYTGKVWIDGKKIYRRVLLCTIATPLSATSGWTTVNGWTVPDTAIEKYISIDCSNLDYGNRIDYQMIASSKALTFYCLSSNITIPVDAPLIIEYTKTT